MALNALGLGFLFSATDLASGVMKNVKGNFSSLEESAGRSVNNLDGMIAKAGAGLAAMAIGVGGVAAAFAIAGKSGEFEQAIAGVGAVANASTEELKQLEDAAIQAGIATQFSPTQATLGLNELAQAGYSVKESIELLNPVLDLAAGSMGGLTPEAAAGLASQAMKAFGIETHLASRAVDQMLQSANQFAVKAEDLPLRLRTAARGAQLLNQSLTETVIAFGLVKNTVPGTERAATSVASAMSRLARQDVQQALKKHRVSVLDANGGYREFLDIVKDLMPALAKMTDGQKGAFLESTFGADALGSLNTIMAQLTDGIKTGSGEIVKGAEAIDYLRHSFRGANGVAADFSKKLLDTYEGQKKLLAGSTETFAILVGKPFKEVLRPAVELVTEGLNRLIGFVNGMDPDVKRFVAGLLVGASVLLAVVGAVLLATAVWPLLAAGLGLATAALGSMAAAALAAAWPVLAVAAVVAVSVHAIRNNIGGLGDVWDQVVIAFQEGGAVVGDIFGAIMSFVRPLWDALSTGR